MGKMKRAFSIATYALRELSPHNVLRNRVDGREIKVRPLQTLTAYPDKAEELNFANVESWSQSENYKKIFSYFENYPESGLLKPRDRAILYHFIRTMKPKHVIEIGTFFAASAEIMTRALWENGEGMLHTVDPLGIHRSPRVIRHWPKALRKRVKYYPYTSQYFFHRWSKKNLQADLVFIDGNHEFEYALFDLLSAARFMRPGGLIVLDDIDQPGPLWAAIEFMRMNPGWKAIGDSMNSFSPAKPFDSAQGLMGTKFFALQAPMDVYLGELVYATGQFAYAGASGTLLLDLPESHPKGRLHGKIYFRRYAPGVLPEQSACQFEAAIDGKNHLTIPLPDAMQRTMREWQQPEGYKKTLEIILYWQPEKQGEALRLSRPPEIVPTKIAADEYRLAS